MEALPLFFVRTAKAVFICLEHYDSIEDARAVGRWLKERWKLPVHFIEVQMRVSFGAGASLLVWRS